MFLPLVFFKTFLLLQYKPNILIFFFFFLLHFQSNPFYGIYFMLFFKIVPQITYHFQININDVRVFFIFLNENIPDHLQYGSTRQDRLRVRSWEKKTAGQTDRGTDSCPDRQLPRQNAVRVVETKNMLCLTITTKEFSTT